jgi:hypothetical protein
MGCPAIMKIRASIQMCDFEVEKARIMRNTGGVYHEDVCLAMAGGVCREGQQKSERPETVALQSQRR